MDEHFDKMLKQEEEGARARVEAGQDKGHNALIWELEHVLEEAKKFEFHDFLNTKYPAPKNALVIALGVLRDHAVNGNYDN